MNTRVTKLLVYRSIRLLSMLSLVLSTFLTTTPNITLAQGEHFFLVRHDQEQVHCNGWTPGETITLTVDDPGTSESPDYTDTGVVWADGSYNFELAGVYDIQPGFIISVSNGTDTLAHTVQNLWITSVDIGADKVHGTAVPGSDVYFEIPAYDGNIGAYRHEIADSAGTWVADYSVAGDEAEEGELYDIHPGDSGEAYQFQGDASTYVSFDLPNPMFMVDPASENVWGHEWTPNSSVSITVNGVDLGQFGTDEGGNFGTDFDPSILNLQSDDHIVVSDVNTTKVHDVTELVITEVDEANNTVSGYAEPGTSVDVWVHDSDAWRHEIADSVSGIWSADFGAAGDEPGEESKADLGPGSNGNSSQCDSDNDCTMGGWWVPNPTFAVRPDGNNVNGWDWTPNAPIDVTIDGNQPFSSQTDEWGYFELNLDSAYDIVPGTIVQVTDGASTKSHTVTGLTIDSVDVDADMVYGSGTPNAQVQVWICWEHDCANRWEMADGSGNWSTDFSVPGDEVGEELTYDIQPGTWVDSGEWDEDGDNTNAGYYVPNPNFAVRLFDAQIEGWEWPLGATVNLTIDDPTTAANPDYNDTQTVVVADWDPNQTSIRFEIDDAFFLQPGHVVTLSDSMTTKFHTIIDLGITNVDLDANTVSGVGEADAQVDLWICEDWGCANRHVTSDSEGNWFADFANPGPQGDEQDTVDIVPGMRGDISQSDEDGDSTQIWWSVADPRLEVSYEHDWVQIHDFTPGGQVTYTIYDYEGGHALFGPVTGPVDSHGSGWISNNLHHLDLVPGYYITAVNEASGEEVSITIQNVNLDYVGIDDDRAFGTAEPNANIELHISETHDNDFNLMVAVNSAGNWEVDLAAAGYSIESYRHANVSLYDPEGDLITAQPPRVHAEVRSDNMSVDNFSKNADVTMTLYDAPASGETILYGPVTLRTESNGSAWVNLWEHGIDLVPGMYITAYDHTLDFTKSLEVELFTFEEMNTAEDYVRGTSLVDEWVDLHVESLFSNWGLEALTGQDGQWYRDYGAQGYDLTDQMWAYGWAVDNQGNWSEDHITGLPNIEASVVSDWISGFNFSPDRPVRVRIYNSDSGSLLAEVETTADGNTQFQMGYEEHGVDLQSGMYLNVVDLETGKTASLELVHLTFDGVDYDAGTAWGRADPFSEVVVRADWFFEHYELVVTADEDGDWFANFAALGADLTLDWGLRALVFDAELDATVADAPQRPEFTASLDGNWISGGNWTPDGNVTIEVFDSEGGTSIFSPLNVSTDGHGNFHYDLWQDGFELNPNQFVRVTDQSSGMTKELVVAGLSIDLVDFESDLAGGVAPPDARLNIGAGNGDWNDFDFFSASDGTWQADFGLHDIDLTQDQRLQLRHNDEDGDATQVEWWIPNPILHVVPAHPEVHGHEWDWNAWVTLTIDDENGNELYADAKFVWDDPWCGEPCFDLEGVLDVVPGMVVTMSDGQSTKVVHVTALQVTGVDPDAETVFGTAEAGTEVQVDIHEEGGVSRNVTVGPDGYWIADFSVEGDEDHEQNTYNLQPGIGGRAIQFEYDNSDDGTLAYWPRPIKFLGANLSPNPVAIEQSVTITATFEGDVSHMQFLIPDVTDWMPMQQEVGAGESYDPETGTGFWATTTPGVYPVVVQACNTRNECTEAFVGFLAVYDPNGGFVTGGGQIVPGGKTSYDDDYLPDIDGESPAVFGFNVKYKKGSSTVPSGHILFQYRRGDLKLHSSDFDWLVITNSVWAKFMGTATIDGYEGLFPFRVDARDSDKLGGSQDDRFIIRIWAPGSDPDHDDPIYQASGDVQGQIVIHDKQDPLLTLGALFEYSAGQDFTFASSNAVQLAVQQANDAGGILGSEVLVYYRDAGDGGSFDVTRASALDLIEGRGVQAIIGPGFSSNTQAILEDIIVPSQVLLASPSNTAPSLAEIPDDGLYFRTVESELVRGRASAWRAYDSGSRTTAVVILRGEPFISEVAQEFMNTFQSYGGEILRVATLDGDPQATIQQAFEGLDESPDVVYVAMWDRNDVLGLVQHALCQTTADGQRASQRYWSFGWENILDEAFVFDASGWNPCGLDPSLVKSDLIGYEQVSPVWAYDLGHAAFREAYMNAFGQDPINFANTAYDAAVLVMLAAEEAGTTDPTAIREHMLSVSSGGTPVSDFPAALEMVRAGEDIDWQGTYAGELNGRSYDINHDFKPDGETINPFLVLQILSDGSAGFVDTVSDANLQAEDPDISLYIAKTFDDGDHGGFIQAAHQLGALLEGSSGQSVSTFVPPGDWISSVQRAVQAAERGDVDIAWLNWIGYLLAHDGGMEAALANFRFGQPYFFSQIWTHDGTSFTSLADLEGVPICYSDPSSASGYVVPSMMLMAEGLDPFEKVDIVGSHPDVIEALYQRRCDGGASFFDARDLLLGTYQDVKDVVLPLAQSPQIPNDGFSFAAHVPDHQRDAAVSAFLNVSDTLEGKELLSTISGGSEGLLQTDHSLYSGLETLFTDAGLTAQQVWEIYYMP